MNDCFVNHLDASATAVVAVRVPIAVSGGASGRLLTRRGQHHLLVADGVPMSVTGDGKGMTELFSLGITIFSGLRQLVGRVAL